MGVQLVTIPGDGRVWAAVLALVLALTGVTACGPSEEEILADLNEACAGMVEDLAALPAEPTFEELTTVAREAGYEVGGAAYRVEDISKTSSASEFADALHALSGAYDDIKDQIEDREYAALAQTREAGEAALATALSAAETLGAPDCARIGLRIDYFAIAADGAAAAAALIAPTGDYVTDVNAACARYAEDTFGVFLKLDLQALVQDDSDVTAGEYIAATEDLIVVVSALEVLARELGALEPPADAAPSHRQLVEGYERASEALWAAAGDAESEALAASIQQVQSAVEQLGVACSI
jgi:hypothetical protein